MCKGKQGMCSQWMRRAPCHTCFTALPLAAAAASFFCFSCRQPLGATGGRGTDRNGGQPDRRAGGSLAGRADSSPAEPRCAP